MQDGPVPQQPSVGIVVVNYNGAAFIRPFAESLSRVDYPNRRIVIVDNGSRDGSDAELQRLLPDAVLLRAPENLGTAGGNNIGIRHCLDQGFDRILILNNDTVLTQDFLSKLVAFADERTIVVPKILYYDDPRLISTHAGDFDWRFGLFAIPSTASPTALRRTARATSRPPASAARSCRPPPSATSGCSTNASSCTTKRPTGSGAPSPPASASATTRKRSSITWRARRAAAAG